MRRILATLGTVVVLAVPLPAYAGAASHVVGGCGFDTVEDPVDVVSPPGYYQGVLYVRAAVYSDIPGDNPVSATISCTLEIRGVAQGTWTFSGTGAMLGAVPVSYDAANPWDATTCETVDYTSDDTPTETWCTDHVEGPLLIQPLYDLLNTVACPIFVAAAPGIPGQVDITPEGSVWIRGHRRWDCSPGGSGPYPFY